LETRHELLQKLGKARGLFLPAKLYEIRNKLWTGLNTSLSQESASLAAAMLLGLSSTVKPSMKETFRSTGTAHLLAISGLHMGLISLLLSACFKKLGLQGTPRFGLLLISLLLFCFLAGSRLPVVRAYLVCVFYGYAAKIQRRVNPFAPLFNAGLVLLVFNPQGIYEISFQLSFAGYFALLLFLRAHKLSSFSQIRNDRSLGKSPGKTKLFMGWKKVVLFLGVSISSWLGTLPLTLYYFQRLVPWTPLINIVAFPFFFLALCINIIHLFAIALGLHHSVITVYPAELSLSLFHEVLVHLSALPWGSIKTPPISPLLVCLSYGFLILPFTWVEKKFKKNLLLNP
jgi:competence protein ComEC